MAGWEGGLPDENQTKVTQDGLPIETERYKVIKNASNMKSLSVIILVLSIMACSEEPSHADCEKLKKDSDQAQAA